MICGGVRWWQIIKHYGYQWVSASIFWRGRTSNLSGHLRLMIDVFQYPGCHRPQRPYFSCRTTVIKASISIPRTKIVFSQGPITGLPVSGNFLKLKSHQDIPFTLIEIVRYAFINQSNTHVHLLSCNYWSAPVSRRYRYFWIKCIK